MNRPIVRLALVAATVLMARQAAPQTAPKPLTGLQRAVACAMPPAATGAAASEAPHVIGSQAPDRRESYAPGDLLVIDRGTAGGLRLNQQFFIRRPLTAHDMTGESAPPVVETAGWLTIVSLDAQSAVGRIDQACGAVFAGDYLEPFSAPDVSDSVLTVDRSGSPDFQHMARVLFGPEGHATAGTGEFVLIDRGTDAGVSVGSRLAIYRDTHVVGVPLAWVGEAAVVAAAPGRALVRIADARDAVESGDFLAPRSNQ
jgi:hypothetical protein